MNKIGYKKLLLSDAVRYRALASISNPTRFETRTNDTVHVGDSIQYILMCIFDVELLRKECNSMLRY